MAEKTLQEKKDNFSVALGLFDYINPIFYTVTSVMLALHLFSEMGLPVHCIFAIGAVLSLIFGFTIPTVKFIVGLGIMKFKMPVNLVFYVNSGIFISGLMLLLTVFKPELGLFFVIVAVLVGLLVVIYLKTSQFNTIAVLTGAFGYLMIYSTMIAYSLSHGKIVSVVLYALAICLFVMLVGIGIKADLKDARVHWVIEISNVCCQLSVALATILVFI